MRVELLKCAAVAHGGPPHREKVAMFDFELPRTKYDVGILAHEGGHSKVHGKLGKWYSKLIPASSAAARIGGPVGALTIGHAGSTPYRKMDKKEKNLRRRLAAVTDVGLHLPQLADEAAATLIGLRDLRRGKVDPAAYRAIKRRLGAAFGTYAATPGGKALMHGANEYAAMKGGGGMSPFAASLLGSMAGVPLNQVAGQAYLSSRGHKVDADELAKWVKKLNIKAPVLHDAGGGAFFMPGYMSKKTSKDPAFAKGQINLPAE